MNGPVKHKRRITVPMWPLVAIAAIVGAVIVWPGDLAWGLLVVAVMAVLPNFEVGFDSPDEQEHP